MFGRPGRRGKSIFAAPPMYEIIKESPHYLRHG